MHLQVAVGLILKDQKIFIAQRPAHKSHAGCWEFPGGKVEENETIEVALARELNEEVGIAILSSVAFKQYQHDYPNYQVTLHAYFIREFENEPQGKEGQITRWINIHELKNYTFPGANLQIIEDLIEEFRHSRERGNPSDAFIE